MRLRPAPELAISASTIVFLVLFLALAFPPPVWADNCFGEVGQCEKAAFWSNVAMFGAVLGAIGYMMSPQGPLGGGAPPTMGELRRAADAAFGGETPPPEYGDPTDKSPSSADARDSAPHGGLGPGNKTLR